MYHKKKRRSLHAPPFPMKKSSLLLLTVRTTLSDSDDISVTSNTVKELHSYKHNGGGDEAAQSLNLTLLVGIITMPGNGDLL